MKKLISKYKEQYYPTYIWCSLNPAIIAFIWLLLEVQNRFKIDFLAKAKFELFAPAALKFFISLLIISPIVAVINYFFTIKQRTAKALKDRLRFNYLVNFSSKEELAEVVKLGGYLVGDSHIDLATLERRYKINPYIVTMLHEKKNCGKGVFIGYYILYPINQEGYIEIMNLKTINGKGIEDSHIAENFNDAVGLYIGMAGGIDGHAKGYVIEELISQIAPILNNSKLRAVFTRGATESGVRISKQYGFQQLQSPSEISCLFINNETLMKNNVKRKLAYR